MNMRRSRNRDARGRVAGAARRILAHGLVAASLCAVGLTAAPDPLSAQQAEPGAIITLDADRTAVSDILQILASRSGLNIVMSPAVQGKVITIHLHDTPADEALSLVVRAAGLGYERIGSSVLVTDVESLAASTGLVTRVFNLKFARAQEIKSMLEVVCKDVSASPQGNTLIIRASRPVVDQVAEIINQLDRKPPQILLEARLVEVNTSSVAELGIDWESITKWNTVIAEGSAAATAPGQLPSTLPFAKINQGADFYRQLSSFQVALDLLITQGRARLLSNAKVVTLDGKTAEVFAGESVPVVVTSLENPGAAGGVLQTVQLQKIDVGVKLSITPRIGADSLITTLVEPEVSQLERFVGPNSDLPQTSTRRASSLVRVHNGEKIYLGGLLSQSKLRSVKKVPLLGDIPLLGQLFRHYRNDDSMLDLVIEVTPRIVGDQGPALPAAPAHSAGEPER